MDTTIGRSAPEANQDAQYILRGLNNAFAKAGKLDAPLAQSVTIAQEQLQFPVRNPRYTKTLNTLEIPAGVIPANIKCRWDNEHFPTVIAVGEYGHVTFDGGFKACHIDPPPRGREEGKGDG